MAYDEPMKADRVTVFERIEILEKLVREMRETLEEQASLLGKVAREVGH